jgi:hypothetical protein
MRRTLADRLDTTEEEAGAGGHGVDGGAAATTSADGSEGEEARNERGREGESEWGGPGGEHRLVLILLPVGGRRRVVVSPARARSARERPTRRRREREMGQMGRNRGTVHLGPVHSASFLFIFLFLFFFCFLFCFIFPVAPSTVCKMCNLFQKSLGNIPYCLKKFGSNLNSFEFYLNRIGLKQLIWVLFLEVRVILGIQLVLIIFLQLLLDYLKCYEHFSF